MPLGRELQRLDQQVDVLFERRRRQGHDRSRDELPGGRVEPGAEPKRSKPGVGKERVRDLPGALDAGHTLAQKTPEGLAQGSHEDDLPDSSQQGNSSQPPRRMRAVQ
jgi:8-oxo-dGTP pyrophosphatase MutT (NUDIX family)